MPNQELKATYGLPPDDVLKRMIANSAYVNGVRFQPEPNEPGEKRFLVVLAMAFGPEEHVYTPLEAVQLASIDYLHSPTVDQVRLMLWDAATGLARDVSEEELCVEAMALDGEEPPCPNI